MKNSDRLAYPFKVNVIIEWKQR